MVLPPDWQRRVDGTGALFLSGLFIGDAGAETVALKRNFPRIHLDSNLLTDKGAIALADIPLLTELTLQRNSIGSAGASALGSHLNLSRLDLGCNHLGDSSAIALSHSTSLLQLSLKGNNIGNAGASHLAKSRTLVSLDLARTRVTDRGALAFCENQTLLSIRLNGLVLSEKTIRCLYEWQADREQSGRPVRVEGINLTLLDLRRVEEMNQLNLEAHSHELAPRAR